MEIYSSRTKNPFNIDQSNSPLLVFWLMYQGIRQKFLEDVLKELGKKL